MHSGPLTGGAGTYAPGAAITRDGTHFTTFTTSMTASPLRFANDGFGGGFIGDYTGGIWTGTTFHQSWMDTRNGTNSQDFTGGVSLP